MLREQLASDNKEVLPDSWGSRQRKRGAQIANAMRRPHVTFDCSDKKAQALASTAEAYSQLLARGDAIDVPILLKNQGQCDWSGQRPTEHVLNSIPNSCTIDVQETLSLEGERS